MIISDVEGSGPCLLQVRSTGRGASTAPTEGLLGPRPHIVKPSISSAGPCSIVRGVRSAIQSLGIRPRCGPVSSCVEGSPLRLLPGLLSVVDQIQGVHAPGEGPPGLGHPEGGLWASGHRDIICIEQVDLLNRQNKTKQLPSRRVSVFQNGQGTLSELTGPAGTRVQGTIWYFVWNPTLVSPTKGITHSDNVASYKKECRRIYKKSTQPATQVFGLQRWKGVRGRWWCAGLACQSMKPPVVRRCPPGLPLSLSVRRLVGGPVHSSAH